ncbi:response regulator [Halovulum sp. GXIMD14793]
MFRRQQTSSVNVVASPVRDRREIYFEFLSNLLDEFTALMRRRRFANFSDEVFATLKMALVHTARESQQYGLTRVYQAAIGLEASIRDVQSGHGGTDRWFDLKRAFDEFDTQARRAILHEEDQRSNLGCAADKDTAPLVLVIDTDHWAHKMVDRAIGLRCVVVSAYNGRAAIETLRTMRPDLVVMDFDLPDLAGADLLEVLKSTPQMATVPVVVSSADNDEQKVVNGLVGGAIDFIPKGTALPDMRRRLLDCLEHGKVRLR